MDFSRVRTGELLAGISGVALFIIMFLKWFSLPEVVGLGGFAEAVGVNTSISAWEAFDFIDLVLLLAVVAGVGLVVLAAAQSSVQLPVAASAIAAGLGIFATLLVLYRVLDPPSDLDRSYGLFLGLIASAGIAVGGWMAMQEEGTSFGGEADRLGGGRGPGAGEPPSPPPPPPPPPPSGGR
jgi:multidrug transporter EmrE-like cation transporter